MSVLVSEATATVTDEVLDAVLRQGESPIIVPSPPGAGKTALVETVTACAVDLDLRVAVAMPRVEQVFAFLRRLTANWKPMRVEALLASTRDLPADLAAAGVLAPRRAQDAIGSGPGVLVATVSKLMMSVTDLAGYDLVVGDEAWQTTIGELGPCLTLAPQTLLVGDPGQLPPVIRADVSRLEARAHRPHWAAPRELLRRFPDARVIPLPASRRLPSDTVELIQPAFYPDLPFVSSAESRVLEFAASGLGDPIDRALDALASGASIVAAVLPAAPALGEMDAELAALSARVAQRLLERGPSWVGERGIGAQGIGVVDPHRNSGTATAAELRAAGVGLELMVSTPEVWQGLERPLIVARHPLIPSRRLSGFDLEPGRFCVATSRHQLGCIIVARDGLGEALEDHSHHLADHPAGADDAEYHGWSAHQALWAQLEATGRVHRL